MATTQIELKDKLQNGTSGTLNNRTVASLQLIRFHTWSGYSYTGWAPENIASNGMARFAHPGTPGLGSKAGLSYTSTSASFAPLAIILAWDAPSNFNPSTSPNKVYGACGPRALIDSMTWDQIEMLLDKSGSSIEIKDGDVCMNATILNNPTTKMADLLANFGSCPNP